MVRDVVALRSRSDRVIGSPQIVFSLDGQTRRIESQDAVMIPFERCSPARTFPTWKGKRHYSGLYWSLTARGHIGFESFAERTTLLMLDRDPAVTAIASQPMLILWPDQDGGGSHVPDYFVRRSDGDGVLIDVKPLAMLDERARASFAATRALCEDLGFHYRVFSDFDQVTERNLRFLARYAVDAWRLPTDKWQLLESLPAQATLGLVAELLADDSELNPLGWVYSLLWHDALHVDLGARLSLDTQVSSDRAQLS